MPCDVPAPDRDIEWEEFSSHSLFGFVLQRSDSIFTAMQGKPDITHNA